MKLECQNKKIRDNIYTALSHVKPDYLLGKPGKKIS